MRGSRGRNSESEPFLENHKAIVYLSNIGLDRQENHTASKPVLNVGPLLAFRFPADDAPLLVVL